MENRRSNYANRFLRGCVLLAGLLVAGTYPGWAHAADAIGVFYPQIREPYAKVFQQIIEGVRSAATLDVFPYALQEHAEPADLREWLRARRCKVVIALGRRGVEAAQALDTAIPIVVGAVLSEPGTNSGMYAGISLVPDPDQLFGQLRQLAPAVERVIVVYNPKKSESLIRLATKAAKAHSLKLSPIKVGDLKMAAKEYRQLFHVANLGGTALWLLQDSTTVDGKVILPLILEQAWKKKLVVFATNPAYVQRGVLFSLYPDNLGMGKSLARIAQKSMLSNSGGGVGMVPLSDLLVAVNLRTAAHLELQITTDMRRGFDLIFPAQ